MGEGADAFWGHAVDTAQIAPVHHENAQIAYMALKTLSSYGMSVGKKNKVARVSGGPGLCAFGSGLHARRPFIVGRRTATSTACHVFVKQTACYSVACVEANEPLA